MKKLIHLALLISLSACVLKPFNDTELPAGAESVRVGVWTPPTEVVTHYRVFASPDQSTWTFVGTLPARGGYNEADVALPAGLWSAEGCDRTIYLQARINDTSDTASIFDELAPSDDPDATQTSYACLVDNYGDGGLVDLSRAAERCRSPESPNLRLRSPVRGPDYVGDLVLDTRAAVDALNRSCARRLVGNLHVPETLRDDIVLPNLEEIEGNVRVDHPLYQGGRDVDRHDQSFARAFPRLRTLDGSLLVTATNPEGNLDTDLEIGFPQLTHVLDGDVELRVEPSLSANVGGFEALRVIEGDLRLFPGENEFEAGRSAGLFGALARVGGDFILDGGAIFHSFSSLTEVGGDVRLAITLVRLHRLLGALTTVGGDFHIRGRPERPEGRVRRALVGTGATSLTRVGRTFTLIFAQTESPTLELFSASTRLGGLVLDDIERLRDFVAPTLERNAELGIHEMPELCRPTVDRRLTEMRRRGWVGPATVRDVPDVCL